MAVLEPEEARKNLRWIQGIDSGDPSPGAEFVAAGSRNAVALDLDGEDKPRLEPRRARSVYWSADQLAVSPDSKPSANTKSSRIVSTQLGWAAMKVSNKATTVGWNSSWF